MDIKMDSSEAVCEYGWFKEPSQDHIQLWAVALLLLNLRVLPL
jgi:hypothetical protein